MSKQNENTKQPEPTLPDDIRQMKWEHLMKWMLSLELGPDEIFEIVSAERTRRMREKLDEEKRQLRLFEH